MTPSTARELIEALLREDPYITATEMAGRAGVSRQRVQVLLQEMGYRQVWRKVPASQRKRAAQ